MIVAGILPAARERLITISADAPLIAAATLLRDLDKDIVVVRDSADVLAGVITKTDIVRQISHCQGASCTAAASAVMTQAVVYCRPDNLLHEIWIIMKERHLKKRSDPGPRVPAHGRAQCPRRAGSAPQGA